MALLILIVFGLGMAVFATQNTGVVHLILGSYLFAGIPLYIVVFGAIILGVFISWLISMVDSLSSLMAIKGKDAALKQERKVIKDLEKQNESLLLEIEKLKEKKNSDREYKEVPQPTLMQHIRSSFS